MSKFKQWVQSMGRRAKTAMYGRYGLDELSRTLSILALVCVVIGLFFKPGIFAAVSLALYIFSCFRMYSRNIAKRRRELEAYYRVVNPVKSWFRLRRRMFAERKTHRYFQCGSCKASLRVPKGKGKIKIHCPKCGAEVVKKT